MMVPSILKLMTPIALSIASNWPEKSAFFNLSAEMSDAYLITL